MKPCPPRFVVRQQPPQRCPELPPMGIVEQMDDLVGHHVVHEPHRRLDDAPIEAHHTSAAAAPALLLLAHEHLGLGDAGRTRRRREAIHFALA